MRRTLPYGGNQNNCKYWYSRRAMQDTQLIRPIHIIQIGIAWSKSSNQGLCTNVAFLIHDCKIFSNTTSAGIAFDFLENLTGRVSFDGTNKK